MQSFCYTSPAGAKPTTPPVKSRLTTAPAHTPPMPCQCKCNAFPSRWPPAPDHPARRVKSVRPPPPPRPHATEPRDLQGHGTKRLPLAARHRPSRLLRYKAAARAAHTSVVLAGRFFSSASATHPQKNFSGFLLLSPGSHQSARPLRQPALSSLAVGHGLEDQLELWLGSLFFTAAELAAADLLLRLSGDDAAAASTSTAPSSSPHCVIPCRKDFEEERVVEETAVSTELNRRATKRYRLLFDLYAATSAAKKRKTCEGGESESSLEQEVTR